MTLSFKKYKSEKSTPVTPITETTVPDHLQHIPEQWNHHAAISGETAEKIHAATNGKTFTSFPLVGHSHHDIDPDVAEHLTKHNYQVKDYVKGIASTKKQVGDPERGIPMREKYVDEKIGSILDKTGASDDVKKSFINDPARSASRAISPHHVVIAHSPMALAGMSTGTAWKNQSCMNLEGGTYRHKVQDDSENGTHVAFLVHHDDKNALKHGEPDNPIARIAIKPYHEEQDDHESDTIFRPETKHYGNGNTLFSNAVSHWANEKYPAKPGVEYTKNSNVYDDSGNETYKSSTKEEIEKNLHEGNKLVERTGAALDKDIIDHAVNITKKKLSANVEEKPVEGNTYFGSHKYITYKAARQITDIGNLNTTHVAALHSAIKNSPVLEDGEKSSAIHALALAHGDKFSTNAMNDYIEKTGSPTRKMMMNAKLPSHVVDALHPTDYTSVRRSLLKPHHYDKVVDGYINNGTAYIINDHSAYLSKEHIDSLANMQSQYLDKTGPSDRVPTHVILASKHFNKDHHDAMISNPHIGIQKRDTVLATSKFSSADDVKKYPGILNPSTLMSNPHLSSEDHKFIKGELIKDVTKPTSNSGLTSKKVLTEFHNKPISSGVVNHFTPEDHETLAKSGKFLKFENPVHSDNHIENIKKLVDKADSDIEDHIDHRNENEPDYNFVDDAEDDEHHQHLIGVLHKHIEHYADAIDNHIDYHVASSGSRRSETIENWDHYNKVHTHLNHLDSLNNYKTPENSNRYADHEHHDDYIADIKDRMDSLHRNTEEFENHDHDNW